MDDEELGDQPTYVRRRVVELLFELLLEVLFCAVDGAGEKTLPELLEVRERPDSSILEEQRSVTEQTPLLPKSDDRIDVLP